MNLDFAGILYMIMFALNQSICENASRKEVSMENVISEFYGMTILMSLDLEDPRPHVVVLYEGELTRFDINTREMYAGKIDDLGKEIIREWIIKNLWPLRRSWDLLLNGERPKRIPPLVD